MVICKLKLFSAAALMQQCVFFLLSWFSFMNIHESQDCRGKGRAFLYLLTTTSNRFIENQTLAGRLLQKGHLCTYPAAGLKPKPLVSNRKSLTAKLRLIVYYLGQSSISLSPSRFWQLIVQIDKLCLWIDRLDKFTKWISK